jgi:hypothetical protein
MNDKGEEKMNGNGSVRMLIIGFGTIISSLLVAGIIGGVIMYGDVQAMKTTIQAQGALIAAQGKDIDKIKSDIYTTKFSTKSNRHSPIVPTDHENRADNPMAPMPTVQ